jgi:hypothetical protein
MTPRNGLVRLAVLAVLATGGWILSFTPASAHVGNQALLYLGKLWVEPAHPAGWTVHAIVVDRDSGKPLPGFVVELTGSNSSGATLGPLTLSDPALRGDYTATVNPPPGTWTMTIDAKGLPGGAEGVPLKTTVKVRLADGVASSTVSHAATPPGDGGGRFVAPMVVAMAAACLVLAAGIWRGSPRTG